MAKDQVCHPRRWCGFKRFRYLFVGSLAANGGGVFCGVVFLGTEGITKVSYCDGHCADTEIAGYQYDLRN